MYTSAIYVSYIYGGSPTCDTEKKKPRKIERGEFITPPRPTSRRSNNFTCAIITFISARNPYKHYILYIIKANKQIPGLGCQRSGLVAMFSA